jgi:hypothetical protein
MNQGSEWVELLKTNKIVTLSWHSCNWNRYLINIRARNTYLQFITWIINYPAIEGTYTQQMGLLVDVVCIICAPLVLYTACVACFVIMCICKWHKIPSWSQLPQLFELGQPSQTVPVGKTVKMSINVLPVERGWQKSVCCGMGIKWTSLHQPHASGSSRIIFSDQAHKRRIINLVI